MAGPQRLGAVPGGEGESRPTCKDCLHWRERDDVAGKGECRRNAPPCSLTCTTSAWNASWPLTLADDWCGAHMPHPVNQQGEHAELVAEVARLKGIISGMADRIAAQSELLSRKAERPEARTQP